MLLSVMLDGRQRGGQQVGGVEQAGCWLAITLNIIFPLLPLLLLLLLLHLFIFL